ncbi:chaplin [Streptomyces oceani]|uniref:Chaplin n=1 Tax=Streptomyces oceani TaxID=1075402 RepID=A0A1E7JYU1_9ACTN|nr:chaplin [Streptomyces oceani]OEU96834.1 chaplin [Streptomyces oceani]
MKNMKKLVAVTIAAGGLIVSGAGVASAADDASAKGMAAGSPGIVSGNVIQVPVDVDANVCGNSISVIGLLNPAFGNVCANR